MMSSTIEQPKGDNVIYIQYCSLRVMLSHTTTKAKRDDAVDNNAA